eukprot:3763262-Rhodomonas_salina.4
MQCPVLRQRMVLPGAGMDRVIKTKTMRKMHMMATSKVDLYPARTATRLGCKPARSWYKCSGLVRGHQAAFA